LLFHERQGETQGKKEGFMTAVGFVERKRKDLGDKLGLNVSNSKLDSRRENLYEKISSAFFMALIEPFAHLIDGVLGTVYGVFSLLPRSNRLPFVQKSEEIRNEKLNSFGSFFSRIYLVVLKMFNLPGARTLVEKTKSIADAKLPGIFTIFLYSVLANKNKFDLEAKKHWKSRFIERLNNLVSIPFVVLARVVDFAFGLIAAVVSLVLLGRNENLNAFAYKQLKVLSIVEDVFGLVRSFLWLDENYTIEQIKEIEVARRPIT
jgi:hypothetical protein